MKYGIWSDGLYMSTYEGGAVGAYAFDRGQMLSGSPATFQSFSIGVGGGVDGRERRIVPADWDGASPPPAGAPNPFAMSFDGAFDGGNDRIEIRSFHVDWANTANTTFTLTDTVNTAAFDTDLSCSPSFRDCLPQPGTTQRVDALSNRLMARLQYRNFGDHQAMVDQPDRRRRRQQPCRGPVVRAAQHRGRMDDPPAGDLRADRRRRSAGWRPRRWTAPAISRSATPQPTARRPSPRCATPHERRRCARFAPAG